MLFGGGENTLETDNQQIADQMRMHVLGSAAHVFLLKAAHALARGGFNFPCCLHYSHRYDLIYIVYVDLLDASWLAPPESRVAGRRRRAGGCPHPFDGRLFDARRLMVQAVLEGSDVTDHGHNPDGSAGIIAHG